MKFLAFTVALLLNKVYSDVPPPNEKKNDAATDAQAAKNAKETTYV